MGLRFFKYTSVLILIFASATANAQEARKALCDSPAHLRAVKVESKTATAGTENGQITLELGDALVWEVKLYQNRNQLVQAIANASGTTLLKDLAPGIYDLEIISECRSGRKYYGINLSSKIPLSPKNVTTKD